MIKTVITILFVFLGIAPAIADEMNADEKAVWALEETYWVNVKSNDIPGYRSLWDERFVGWPGFSRQPMG